MPPRRSSRAPSVSQTPVIEAKPIKRKRGQTLEPHNVDLEEDDDVEANPKRGKRASSVVKPSRPPRRSSRTENAPSETAPVDSLPVKRKRGQTSIQSHILEEEEIKLEEEEEVDANLKSAAPIDNEEEEAPPAPKSRRTTKPKVSIQQSDDEMDEMSALSETEEDDDVKPIRKGKVPTARKAKPTTKKSIKTTVIEESDDDSDIQAPPNAQPRSQLHNGAADPAHVSNSERQPSIPQAAAEEDLEETSLFDPPPMPEPSNLPRTIPEEPTGPKSRLVIYKMVLVNFKSYAGRQEIGPFHKVIQIKQSPTIKADLFTVVLFHCWTQWIRKIQYDRCSLICIRIPRLKDEARQDIRTHSHFRKFPRS